jgi:hypothetical protein
MTTAGQPVPEQRWPVQGERSHNRPLKPAGTVGDAEARAAYEEHVRLGGRPHAFEPLHRAGGFSYGMLTDLLGHKPTTWRAKETHSDDAR